MGEALSKADSQMQPVLAIDSRPAAWYAIQTSYRHEQRVAGNLSAKGFETFLPLLREVHQWKDRKKAMEVPAFGGYLFVHLEPSVKNRVRVLETAGIVRMLGGNHAPVSVDDAEIEALRQTLESGVSCTRCESMPVGSMVRVKSGPLGGVQGRLLRFKSSLRLVIGISAVSQAISAEVDLKDVEPAMDLPLPSRSDAGSFNRFLQAPAGAF